MESAKDLHWKGQGRKRRNLLPSDARMAILPDDFLMDIMKKGYEKEIENKNKTVEEAAETRATRLKGYLSICVSGLATLYWSGSLPVFKEIHQTHPNLAYIGVVYSLVVVLLNLAGVAAAYFPSTTPFPLDIAGLAAWQSMISVLVNFHVATFIVHPKLISSIISMFVSLFIITVFWGMVAQDPNVLHALSKYVVWTFCKLYDLLISRLKEAIDFSPVTQIIASVCHTVRGYLEFTPGFLPAEFMADITVKGYLKGKTKEEIEKAEDSRLSSYLSMCISGVGTLYWTGAVAMLLELNKTHPTESYSFLLYSLFSIVVMLLAITASTFPSTAHGKMEFSGLGAWQAIMFAISTYHLATFKLHPGPVYFWISISVSSALSCVFWGITSQDPLFIHVAAKIIIWCFCWTVYGIYFLGCKIARPKEQELNMSS
ncbi:unnamed protein product [Urochloa decumbens]|uniref:Uncharacterized protein n=1 Tax=Urochloa decumbens TaxID=240449 RepID=A0ABC9AVK5_9POAL